MKYIEVDKLKEWIDENSRPFVNGLTIYQEEIEEYLDANSVDIPGLSTIDVTLSEQSKSCGQIQSKCNFDNNGCEALACYSNEKCNSRDKNGNPMYKINEPKEQTESEVDKEFEKWYAEVLEFKIHNGLMTSTYLECKNPMRNAFNAGSKSAETKIANLEAENKKLNMETYEQMELMKKGIERIKELEKENEELKTMVNRNAGDAIYHQAEKIKLQDINATLKSQLESSVKTLKEAIRCKGCRHYIEVRDCVGCDALKRQEQFLESLKEGE